MRAHARIRIRCERVQCEHMRAYANARIRIASHANAFLMRHASIRIRYLGVFRVRYARICAHSHEMRAHSHRMRSHSHRMRSHRMRMRAFKGNLCVSGTVRPSHDHLFAWKDSRYIQAPDSKVHGANMGPTRVLSAPRGPHIGHIYLVSRVDHEDVILAVFFISWNLGILWFYARVTFTIHPIKHAHVYLCFVLLWLRHKSPVARCDPYTVKCRYNAVHFITILHTALR